MLRGSRENREIQDSPLFPAFARAAIPCSSPLRIGNGNQQVTSVYICWGLQPVFYLHHVHTRRNVIKQSALGKPSNSATPFPGALSCKVAAHLGRNLSRTHPTSILHHEVYTKRKLQQLGAESGLEPRSPILGRMEDTKKQTNKQVTT